VTERIDQLLAAKDTADLALYAELDDDDRADAFARATDQADPFQAQALRVLALADPSPGGLLAQAVPAVLAQSTDDPFIAAAALLCGAALGRDAMTIALAAVSELPDPIVALAGWRVLQQVGVSAILDEMARIAPAPGDPVGDAATFATAVVAHRAGNDGFPLVQPDETHIRAIPGDDQDLSPITASPVSAEDLELVARMTGAERHLVELPADGAGALAVDCAGDHMVVWLDADVGGGTPDTLLQAPALAGVVAVADPFAPSLSTMYLALTWPDGEGGFQLGLFEPGGVQAYRGHATSERIAGGEATFGLFVLDAPGLTPVDLTVTLSAAGIAIADGSVSMNGILVDRLDP
jgi:hypothetical protein